LVPKRWSVYRNLSIFLFLLVLIVQIGCGGGSSSGSGTIPHVSHVLVLVEENHSYGSVIGNPTMPYTNSLAQQYALATSYYANAHPSLLNYFMLTVGQTIAQNDTYAGTVSADNVVRALTAAGKTWKAYAESLPNPGHTGASVYPYARDHNPFAYFDDVRKDSSQAANIVPFAELARDAQNDTLPDYGFIIPNIKNDGHDCPPGMAACADGDKVVQIDEWVRTNIAPLISSRGFANSVLIYTWDESVVTDTTNGGGHVATILIGDAVRKGYQSTRTYQHQSTLRLTMQLLGVTDYPGAAATAPDMTEFF
jgi:phosphatidylinositol-3-phosphatase